MKKVIKKYLIEIEKYEDVILIENFNIDKNLMFVTYSSNHKIRPKKVIYPQTTSMEFTVMFTVPIILERFNKYLRKYKINKIYKIDETE